MQNTTYLKLKIFLHLFLVYISWGTTYIGFKLTLKVVGPFFACGLRMTFAGALLALLLLCLGKWQPVRLKDLTHAAIYAILLVVLGSGMLSFGQQYLPSGVAAIITGSTPITMLWAGYFFAGQAKPTRLQTLGLACGALGLLLLMQEQYVASPLGLASLWGVLSVLTATFGWVAGSLLIKRYPREETLPPLEDCALLLFLGGLESLMLGLLCGEQHAILWDNLNGGILLAFSWMVIGGSIIAYSSYFWLLEHVAIAVAVSYEYVVPVIGLFSGWLVCDEIITPQMIFACCLSIGAVFLVIRHK
ncbi:MAG: EamA family transporter [Desulfovibrionaceae bacterium]|nr:EamA family transporter [Desulfovibrionaceae bacterium]